MKADVRGDLAQPIVWQTAQRVVSRVSPRDEIGQANAIHDWLATPGRYRFVNTPVGVQLLESPVYQLEQIRDNGFVQGNCADAAELAAALLEAIGIQCRFIAVGFKQSRSQFSHVFTVAYCNNRGTPATLMIAHPKALGFPVIAEEFDVTRPTDIRRVQFVRHQSFPA